MNIAEAHVGYIVQTHEAAGTDWSYLAKALFDPFNIVLMLATVGLVLVLYFLLPRLKSSSSLMLHMHWEASEYTELRSWILRLSLGISLIGAGLSRTIISPIVHAPSDSIIPSLETFAGFFLLAGFLIEPAAILVLVFYAFSLLQSHQMLGNLESAAAALSLLVLANPRPGLDHMFGIPSFSPIKFLKDYVPFILRLGIGFAMFYSALYEKIFNPHLADIVVHQYHLTDIVPTSANMWVLGAGIIESIIGILLILGLKVRTVSVVTFAVLVLSFFYFGEEVYSHVTLFGVLSILFITGAGKLSLDHKLRK